MLNRLAKLRGGSSGTKQKTVATPEILRMMGIAVEYVKRS